MLAHERALFEDALSYLWEALPSSQGIDTGRMEAVIEGNLGLAFIGPQVLPASTREWATRPDTAASLW
jgi:hypothetical protein